MTQVPTEGEIRIESQVTANEVDLFMFSAATWLTHRIHYDRDYARSEGFKDLVVHGPFQGARLSQMLVRIAAPYSGLLTSLSYRHHKAAYCKDTLTYSLTLGPEIQASASARQPTLVHVDVSVRDSSGDVVTNGHATLEFADTDMALRFFGASRDLV